jgi:hypothetical protein
MVNDVLVPVNALLRRMSLETLNGIRLANDPKFSKHLIPGVIMYGGKT